MLLIMFSSAQRRRLGIHGHTKINRSPSRRFRSLWIVLFGLFPGSKAFRNSLSRLPQGVRVHCCSRIWHLSLEVEDLFTHRLLSSSFWRLPYRILNTNHKRDLLRSIWADQTSSSGRLHRFSLVLAPAFRRSPGRQREFHTQHW